MSKLELTMIRDGGCLRPTGKADGPSWAAFDAIRTTKPVIVTVHQARNPDHHAKIWAIAAKVADFSDFRDAEAAMRWVKRQIPGMHRRYRDRDGSLVIELESISFASMDQISFNAFYDEAVRLWAELIKCDPVMLRGKARAA